MNKIFKLKFNRQTKQMNAVSEIATNAISGSGNNLKLSTRLAKLASLLLPLTFSFGQALAQTPFQVVAGNANLVTNGLVTTITNSKNAILEWDKFNINSNELVRFIQESSDSAVLNRVLGGSVSQILGTLESNGKVFIVNPAGIVFGENSVVNVQSLVASTLDISNEDFINGNYVFNQGKDQALAQVLNQGVIKVNDDGTLALVGGQVVNTGVLEAKNGTVYLLAGQSITIQDLDNPLISYKVTADNKAVNLGEIVSKKARLAANHVAHGYTTAKPFADLVAGADSAKTATISAQGHVTLDGGDTSLVNGAIVAGQIDVLANGVVAVESNAHLKANQLVRIGGDALGKGEVKLASKTLVQAGAVVDTSATGDAGDIVVWGNQAAVAGKFLATSETGQGGLVETSGKVIRLDGVDVDTRSTLGTQGTWLIDPHELQVLNSTAYDKIKEENSIFAEFYDFGDSEDLKSGSYTVAQDESKLFSYLKDDDLTAQLKQTNVVLQINPEAGVDSTIKFDNANVEGNHLYGLTLHANNLELQDTNIYDLAYFNFTSTTGVQSKNARFTSSTLLEVKELKVDVNANITSRNSTFIVDKVALVAANLTANGSLFTLSRDTGTTSTLTVSQALILNQTTVDTGGSLVTNGKGAVTLTRNSRVEARSLKLESDATVNLQNSILNATEGNLELKANQVSLNQATLKAANGKLDLQATTALTSTCSTLTAGQAASLTSTGTLTLNQDTIETPETLTITGQDKVTLTNPDLTVEKDISVKSSQGSVTVENLELNPEADLNLEAKTDLNVRGSTLLSMSDDINLTAANLKLEGSHLTLFAGALNVSATGTATLKDNTITLLENNLNLTGTSQAELSNNSLSAKNINLEADSLTSKKDSFTATDLNVTTKQAFTSQDSSYAIRNNASLTSEFKLTISNTDSTKAVNATNALSVKGYNVDLTNANLTANNGLLKVEGTGSINLTKVNLNATADELQVVGGKLTATDSVLKAKDDLTLATKTAILNNTTLESQANLNLRGDSATAEQGTSFTGENVYLDTKTTKLDDADISATGEVAFTNKEAGASLTLEDTEITATDGLRFALDQGEVTLEKAHLTVYQGDLDVKAKDLKVGSTTVTAFAGNINLDTDTANLNALTTYTKELEINASEQLTVAGSQLNAENAQISTENLNLQGSTIYSDLAPLAINATTATLNNANLRSYGSAVNLKSDSLTADQLSVTGRALNLDKVNSDNTQAQLSLSHTSLVTQGETNINHGTVNLEDISITSRDLAVKATDLTTSGSTNVFAQNSGTTSIETTGDLKLANTFTTTKDLSLNAGNDLTLENNVLNAPQIELVATNEVKSEGSIFDGDGSSKLSIKAATTTIASGEIDNFENLEVDAKEVNLTGNKLQLDAITITGTETTPNLSGNEGEVKNTPTINGERISDEELAKSNPTLVNKDENPPEETKPVEPEPEPEPAPAPAEPVEPAPADPTTPGTEPATDPKDPGTGETTNPSTPADPGTTPTDPSTTEPVDQPTEPGEQAKDPSETQPTDPVAEPKEPVVDPDPAPVEPDPVEEPAPAPVDPKDPGTTTPTEPGTSEPVEPAPVDQPTEPVEQPKEPGETQPTVPVEDPKDPSETKPAEPVEPEPTTPVEPAPTEPVVPAPTDPVDQPTDPVEQPTDPVEPVVPTPVQPVEPAPTPVQPVEPAPTPVQPAPVEPGEGQPGLDLPPLPANFEAPDAFREPNRYWFVQSNADIRNLNRGYANFSPNAQDLPVAPLTLPTQTITITGNLTATQVIDQVSRELNLDPRTQTIQSLLSNPDLTSEQRQLLEQVGQ
ncbi:hypothetical protein CJP74_00145 [Psittacicella melopsittaci]|uniref:Filamentous haemagglutinin FhaB/tRNA nuclease CdiA-like TPS domain-containing protein n=1 Tax=Psittacicella melopsittaci TaxID=2028576 RepID=A0A3A1YD11_9GAMM|nr:filamentous hemagglutinin N-terminal domain-containing protein [Psittacicella melopsittaci]RIY34027.1 hypothetical protein CJP74_00145 [Psittacicella melopsittaci]